MMKDKKHPFICWCCGGQVFGEINTYTCPECQVQYTYPYLRGYIHPLFDSEFAATAPSPA